MNWSPADISLEKTRNEQARRPTARFLAVALLGYESMSSHGHDAAALALDFLDEATKRAKRLKNATARKDGLHRFRVSVRRLRVHLKVHGKACRIPRKIRRRLRNAFRRTNAARDAQVALSWINGFAARQRRGGADASMLAAEAARLCPPVLGPETWREFLKLAKIIRRSLRDRRRACGRGKFKKNCEIAARLALRTLSRRISKLDHGENSQALHKVRVSAKRLRYIREPVEERVSGVPSLQAVKKLQRLLGDIHDLSIVEAKLKIMRHGKPFLDEQATSAIDEVILRRAGLLSRARRQWLKLRGRS